VTAHYTIRKAVEADVDAIVALTMREAHEAEQIELHHDSVTRGVRAGFLQPRASRYWVAESTGGDVVASTSVVREWSNFHGGWYWWIQSLFIIPEHRGTGLADQLLQHLTTEASAAGALDLRLYVHASNERAIRAYERYGFRASPYAIMSKGVR
jgi:ribosomal protein S18 acetylase RimI-like enzyme